MYDIGGGEKEMNVLVVDDDREIVDSISIFLSGRDIRHSKPMTALRPLIFFPRTKYI